MAFVANARPEQSDTHSCSLNKGIGWESRTRKESLFSVCSLWIIECKGEGRIPKVAVILKYCFPCGKSPRAVKTGHWKGCHGSERRLKQCVCVKERSLYAWMDKSEDLQTTEMREPCAWYAWDVLAFKLSGMYAAGIPDTKAMVMTIIVFLIHKILFILTGRCWQVTPPAGTKGSIDTREGSKWINEK